jgi:predicted alpha/beta-hydrolase family hydrolase
MARMQSEGRRRPPDREPVLVDTLRGLIDRHRGQCDRLVIGGKSMGGRIASLVADDAGVDGLVCLGFPFHPPGRPERFRADHLAGLRTPTLICQGERDPFGRRDEVDHYAFSPACAVAWIDDGEHSFKPRNASGRTWEQNLTLAVQRVSAFLATLCATPMLKPVVRSLPLHDDSPLVNYNDL